MNNFWSFVHPAYYFQSSDINHNTYPNGYVLYPTNYLQQKQSQIKFYFSNDGPQFQAPQISKTEKLDIKKTREQQLVYDQRSIDGENIEKFKKQKKVIGEQIEESCSSVPMSFQRKGTWSDAQERKLKELVNLFGQQWKQICDYFPDRNPKQIRQRYLNYLRPNLSSQKWSKEEDDKIIKYVQKHGRAWKLIQKKLKNRSQNQIKNRYYGHLKKKIEKETFQAPNQNQI